MDRLPVPVGDALELDDPELDAPEDVEPVGDGIQLEEVDGKLVEEVLLAAAVWKMVQRCWDEFQHRNPLDVSVG